MYVCLVEEQCSRLATGRHWRSQNTPLPAAEQQRLKLYFDSSKVGAALILNQHTVTSELARLTRPLPLTGRLLRPQSGGLASRSSKRRSRHHRLEVFRRRRTQPSRRPRKRRRRRARSRHRRSPRCRRCRCDRHFTVVYWARLRIGLWRVTRGVSWAEMPGLRPLTWAEG